MRKIRVGITMGDPSGIGPAIVAKALEKIRLQADFVVIGDRRVFDRARGSGLGVRGYRDSCYFSRSSNKRKIAAVPIFVDLANVSQKGFEFGKVKAEYGRASIEYLDKALELIKNEEIDCLVTCPISKESINKAGFKYLGHTEYFAGRLNVPDTVMMLLNRELKFSLVSRHIPLEEVPRQISKEKIYKTINTTINALKKLFLIRNPRIVVCGLNPHASDNGVIGDEENRIIAPVIRELSSGNFIDGPISADVAISYARQKKYDAVIAMYHDQALIPLKLYGNFSGVNLTLGLPFIRTSPLHGTAFDIAQNPRQANPSSLTEAVKTAIRCASNLKKN